MATSRQKTPVLIIGGGLIGLSIAYELAREGQSVEILSRKRKEAARFVAAGMLAPHAEGLSHKLLQLGQLSLNNQSQWINRIEKDSGINCGLSHCGIIVPFLNHKDVDLYPTSRFGKVLNRLELEKEINGIASKWVCGLLFPQDGQIDNRRLLMRALEKSCIDLGVIIQEGVEVIEIINHSKKFQGVRIKDVKGNIAIKKANEGVICSGAWGKQILNDLPIFPIKGQMLSIQGPINAFKRVLFGPGTYLVPRNDGLIIVGATSEKDAGFQQGLTPSGQRELITGLEELLPEATRWPQMERWWGFRPCTPDEGPLLGMSAFSGLWIATGHYRNGVLMASITAELLKKCICNQALTNEESDLLKTFDLKRFKKK